MITLAKHIELLLLEHDCVIVPGLGGFIANHADAQYSGEQENLLIPPYRTIGFNQQLQMNDGLLVQSYMTAYDTSYPFANLQMEKDLEKMMLELEMNGEYTLENIGVLKKGLNQNITFIAPETGVLTPSLYGLYSCEMKSLVHVVKDKETKRKLEEASSMMIVESEKPKPEETKKPKDVVIHLNRRWLDLGISVAAAVVLLFCVSYPAMKKANIETDTVVAAFHPLDKTPNTKVPSSKIQPAAIKGKNEAAKVAQTETKKATDIQSSQPVKASKQVANTEKTEKTDAQAEKFTIVLASYVSQANAETFLTNLSKEGFTEGKFVKNGKVSRILYSGYTTENEAQEALKALRQENVSFAEAWIMAL